MVTALEHAGLVFPIACKADRCITRCNRRIYRQARFTRAPWLWRGHAYLQHGNFDAQLVIEIS
jgi:hypothetical protein